VIRLDQPAWLLGLWLLPALGALALLAWRWRRSALRSLAEEPLHADLHARTRAWPRVVRGAMAPVAAVLIALALARPQWNPQPQEVTARGRDVVFLIDVSRSMLARDMAPSRLGRAKIWIRDLVSSLEGDRVGLVAFAGAPVVKCPLTLDHAFFALALDELSPDSVPRGGTNIGDAIRKTVGSVFGSEPPDGRARRDIILITDGEDQESLPVDAARRAADAGVRIIALGIGSEAGAPVPAAGDARDTVTYRGEEVRSAMDSGTLERIATATPGGAFLNVGTGSIDLEEVYRDLIRSAEQGETGETTNVRYDEGFQWLLLPALTLIFLETLLHDRRA
jgi:Ca-activated chloride channel family protein